MDYKELDVWLKARELVKKIYILTTSFPNEEQYGLTSQIRRSSISMSSNIAEGCGRQTAKETIYFLHIARGSLFELETQVILADDLGYTTTNAVDTLKEIERVKMLLNGFINYHKKL
ncbi:four helix bundle protein [Euzebyella marina]|uniref:Four helix bundle protein n=1 Tax=Euzebyella marina TaxID=1761453 RepID=A0A3G2L3P6_9FLAO|nr:four helix bundle protein [Euzebyella marina]AYN66843.1 four helix bundle protein [Euzebyella marina]